MTVTVHIKGRDINTVKLYAPTPDFISDIAQNQSSATVCWVWTFQGSLLSFIGSYCSKRTINMQQVHVK